MGSQAFPSVGIIRHTIHRPPYNDGWMLEETAYEKFPALAPEDVARFYFSGQLQVWREVPGDTMWLRPSLIDHERGWREMLDNLEERMSADAERRLV